MAANERRIVDVSELAHPSSRTQKSTGKAVLNLRAHALAAVATKIVRSESAQTEAPELQFLFGLFDLVSRDGTWFESFSAYLQKPNEADAPLIDCANALGLTSIEILAVSLTAAVEDDLMVGRVLARLQAPVGGSRPTLGLLASAFADLVPKGHGAIDILSAGVAIQSGLLTLMNDGAPLPERTVAVPIHLCQALNGVDGTLPGLGIGANQSVVPLPASLVDQAENHARALLATSQRILVLRTGFNEEGRAVAELIAKTLNRRALFIDTDKWNGLGPWLLMRGLVPVFCFELGPGERKILPSIPTYNGPVLALCGPEGSVEGSGSTALNWTLPVPPVKERQSLWQIAIGDPDLAFKLARDHRHGSGRIAQLGRLAHHHGRLRGLGRPTLDDVVAASWSGEGVGLEALAQPIRDAISDEALVMTSTLSQELKTFLLRCRSRDGLAEGLGASASARYHPGVRALFVGPSGTGKTMATGWLARKLGLPLYRVDLASIISKYIGETEKNLAQLLARAERAEVVLLFDEADSLFGKRTDVKEANDRFANAQTNYLLQRIESFDGITILTSNSRSRFDEAFTRRLDMIVDFPLPGPEERRSLWLSHLGSNHSLDQKTLNQLSAVADLSGGHIRNVVLTAAVLAQEESRAIKYEDVIGGLAGEYRKLGRQLPVELNLVS
jgi:hypothetical protein